MASHAHSHPAPSGHKRKRFWVDAPLQLQIVGTVLALVAGSLGLVSVSLHRGLQDASAQSRQIFHSLDWVLQTIRGPLWLSGLISVIGSGLIALLWSHRFAGPLRVLSAGMHRLRGGNFTVPVGIRNTDCLADVVEEFSLMQQDLKKRLAADRHRAETLGRRLEEILEALPKNNPERPALETVSQELKKLCADYQL